MILHGIPKASSECVHWLRFFLSFTSLQLTSGHAVSELEEYYDSDG